MKHRLPSFLEFKRPFSLLVLTVCFICSPGNASEGLQELAPYRLWLEELELHRSTLANPPRTLAWIVKVDGVQELARSANNETAYTYFGNDDGHDYTVYLHSWFGDRYAPISNTVGYRTDIDYSGPIISSEREEVAVKDQPYSYQITATGSPTGFRAENLPPGLSVDRNGLISGTPLEVGLYLVTLSAENNRDWTTATLKLNIVSGNNGGGLLNSHTIVVDPANWVVTRTHGDGPISTNLTWIFLQDGKQVLARNALSETRTEYYYTFRGEVTVYLSSMGQKVSNILIYGNSSPDEVAITSPSLHTGTMGRSISPYTIETDKPCFQFSITGLPSGLEISSTGVVSGSPTEFGRFPTTIYASGPDGTVSKTVVFQIDSGDANYTTNYQLKIDENQVVHRSEGNHHGLMWTVWTDQGEVIRRPATGQSKIHYSAAPDTKFVQVRLEAWINGKSQRVSNTITYKPDGTTFSAPVFTIEPWIAVIKDIQITPINVLVSGIVDYLNVTALPPGLSFNQNTSVIEGTPTQLGTYFAEAEARNAAGTTREFIEFKVLQQQDDSLWDRFPLTMTENYTVQRSLGNDQSLRWVVYRNGERVYEYADTGQTWFNYRRHTLPGEFAVFLEAMVEGSFQRVSNILGYRTFSKQQGPVLLNPRELHFIQGREVDYQFVASDKGTNFTATTLPQGLEMDSVTGRITGTPLTASTVATVISVSKPDATSATPVLMVVTPPHSSDRYQGLFNLEQDDQYRVYRSSGGLPGLVWTIERNNQIVLQRNAQNETLYTYNKNYIDGAYTIYLQAYIDGQFRIVSNVLSYNVDASSDFSNNGLPNLVEHAIGNRPGREPIHPKPYLDRLETHGEVTHLVYRYTVNTSARDVTLYLENSTTLGQWSRADSIRQSIISADENFELREEVFVTEGDIGFLRMTVEGID